MNRREAPWLEAVGEWLSKDGRVHLVGVGNPIRGDDAAGLEVARTLKRTLGRRASDIVIHSATMSPERELSRIPASERVVIVDAVEAQKEPGTIVCARVGDARFGFFATHNIPLTLIPGLKERAGDALLVGIQPESLDVGEGLSPVVRESVENLVREFARILEVRP